MFLSCSGLQHASFHVLLRKSYWQIDISAVFQQQLSNILMTFNARCEQSSSTQFIHKVNIDTCNENQQTTIILTMLMTTDDDNISPF